MTANDHRATLQAASGKASFNAWLCIAIDRAEEGDVELSLPWRSEFGQYSGYLHASIVSGLIDTACGFAAATISGGVLASQLSVRFLRPAVADVFIARGRVIKAGRKQIFASGELYARDAPDKLLAVGDAILVPTEG